MLLLSGNRQFCVALNAPFNTKLPADLPLFTGSHSDLVIIVLHKLSEFLCLLSELFMHW